MGTIEDKPTVIFLDYFEDLEKVMPFIGKICNGLKCRYIIVSSNFDTRPLAVFTDSKIIYFDEFLSRQDYEFMDRYVFNLTQTWHSGLKSIEGITEYKGIRFDAIVEERAQEFFSLAIKKLEIVLKIVERLQPNKIFLIGEKNIFLGLSKFIKEELNISTVFMKVEEKENFIRRTIKKSRQCIIETVSSICDNLMQKLVIKKRRNNGIFIDTRLYFEIKDLSKEFYPYLYLIEKGFRIRLRLIKEERFLFAPILVENFFRLSSIFSPFYRYWKFIRTDIEFQNKFKYKNLLILRLLEKVISELIIYDFSQAKKNIIILKKLYKALEPKVVVLREAVRGPERTIVLTARQEGIPTLVVQHGILAVRNVYTKLFSDKIAVWGKAGIDWYGSYGNDISKCIITGKPNHDLIYFKKNFYKDEPKDCFLKIGMEPKKESILYIPSFFKALRYPLSVYNFKDSEYMALNAILNIVKYFSTKQLIIKIHPFDSISAKTLSNRITEYSNVFVVKKVDIIPLIKNSSLVISGFSSAALDAVILNKPVITLNFDKREDLIPFAQRGVALSVTNPEQLHQAVVRIFEDEKLKAWLASNRESFIYDYAYKIDGKSTERVLALIKRLYNESKFSKMKDLKDAKLKLIFNKYGK